MKYKLFFFIIFLSWLHLTQLPGEAFQKKDIEMKLGKTIQDHIDFHEMLQLTSGSHILGFREKDMFIASNDHAIRVEFINAKPVLPVEDSIGLDTKDKQMSARILDKVIYKDLWDGISLAYEKSDSDVVSKTYTIHSSGQETQNPVDQIRLHYNVPVEVDESGNLLFSFETGQMIESLPIAWQQIRGKRVPVEVAFHTSGEQEVSFRIGPYNSFYPLTIHVVLYWHTFIGSVDSDSGSGIALDKDGNILVVGGSSSTWGIPLDPHAGGGRPDVFVVKFNSNGVLQWNTFIGSEELDLGDGIAIDSKGNILVVGRSHSTWGAPINPIAGWYDVFVAKLNSNGVRLWNTFMGSFDLEYGLDIAVDSNGNIYTTGYGYATWGAPVNPHTEGRNRDAFVAKIKQDNPPSASITSPTNNSVVFGTVDVEADASDDFGIDKVEFEIDGELIATDSASPYSFLWNTGPVTAGQHYIKAIAHDTREQTGEDEIQVTVNKLNLMLNASREVERAWIIRREYGKINLNVIDWSVLSVMKFIIYKKKAGSEYQIIKEITPEEIQGNEYTYYDQYLEQNVLYTYKVIAIGWNSTPIGASSEKII